MLGLLQLAFIASFAIGLGLVTGAIELPASAVAAAAIAIGYFVLGFAFYASLFAVAGSLVTRMEELQNALCRSTCSSSSRSSSRSVRSQIRTGRSSTVASVLPVSSALAMPVRIVLGAATPVQVVLSLALSIGVDGAAHPGRAAALYAGAVLRTGARVKLRDAWRAAA